MGSWFTSSQNQAMAITPAKRVWPRTIGGYVLALVCLFWVLRDFDLTGLLRRVADMKPSWIAAAIVFDILSYVCQGVRWHLLLRPPSRVTVISTTKAIYAGLFVNEVLPLKLGEVVRATLMSRWTALKLRSIIASIFIERLWDGLWLAVGVVLVIMSVPLPRRLMEAADVFDLVILLALLAFGLFVFSAPKEPASPSDAGSTSFAKRVTGMVREGLLELRSVGYTRASALSCIISLLMLLLQGLSFWFVMRAFGLHVSFLAGLAVYIIVHVGTIIPAAPANIGTYQFFTVLGLTLFGVDRATAVGFSLVVFGVLTIPLWAIGFWAFASSGLTLFEVTRKLGRKEAQKST